MKSGASRHYFWLYLLSFTILFGVSTFQHSPGYMDAAYYFSGGLRLAEGAGFQDMLLWHYLDAPQGLPNPSHGYWMPLTSIISFIGIKLFFFLSSFEAAQWMFVLLSAGIAPLTAALAEKITKEKDIAIFSGLLAVAGGFYLPFLVTTDAFSLYMLGGGVFFLLLMARPPWLSVGLGLVTGWMYLARADGALWFFAAAISLVFIWRELPSQKTSKLAKELGGLGAGFMILAGPWLLRNLLVYGALSAPGGSHAFWFVSYDDLFAFPAVQLTASRWLEAGWPIWWQNWRFALGSNLQSFAVVQGGIVLFPFMLVGLWQSRKHFVVRLAGGIWLTLFVLMSIIFPFAGARGGFFHSGSAFMPLFWVMMTVGLYRVVKPLSRLPRWSKEGAWRLVRLVSIAMFFLLNGLLLSQTLFDSSWGTGERLYIEVEVRLVELGAQPDDIVLVNNPPSYYAVTQRPAIVIPNGDSATLLTVAHHYQAVYIILEAGGVAGLQSLYDAPLSGAGLEYIDTVQDVHIFKVVNE